MTSCWTNGCKSAEGGNNVVMDVLEDVVEYWAIPRGEKLVFAAYGGRGQHVGLTAKGVVAVDGIRAKIEDWQAKSSVSLGRDGGSSTFPCVGQGKRGGDGGEA